VRGEGAALKDERRGGKVKYGKRKLTLKRGGGSAGNRGKIKLEQLLCLPDSDRIMTMTKDKKDGSQERGRGIR